MNSDHPPPKEEEEEGKGEGEEESMNGSHMIKQVVDGAKHVVRF